VNKSQTKKERLEKLIKKLKAEGVKIDWACKMTCQFQK
jgi:GH35 family endo-1,4-beta-xylanase